MKEIKSARVKRHRRIRVKISGQAQRPRLVVYRALDNLSAQLVDDTQNKTILSLSTFDKKLKGNFPTGGNVKAAAALGEIFAKEAKGKGVIKIVFDRAGYLYHGRVKAFAEALRKGGLEF
jgi:large subunit ribosomal protein L18